MGRRPQPNIIAALVAQGLSDTEIATMLGGGLTRQSVRSYRRQQGLGSRFVRAGKPAPANFAEVAAGMSVAEVQATWGCRFSVAKRWLAEAGIDPRVGRRRVSPKPRFRWRRPSAIARTHGADEAAANALRARHANVFRCNILLRSGSIETYGSRLGLPDRGAGHWFIAGVGVVDRDTLFAMAREEGWTG